MGVRHDEMDGSERTERCRDFSSCIVIRVPRGMDNITVVSGGGEPILE